MAIVLFVLIVMRFILAIYIFYPFVLFPSEIYETLKIATTELYIYFVPFRYENK